MFVLDIVAVFRTLCIVQMCEQVSIFFYIWFIFLFTLFKYICLCASVYTDLGCINVSSFCSHVDLSCVLCLNEREPINSNLPFRKMHRIFEIIRTEENIRNIKRRSAVLPCLAIDHNYPGLECIHRIRPLITPFIRQESKIKKNANICLHSLLLTLNKKTSRTNCLINILVFFLTA